MSNRNDNLTTKGFKAEGMTCKNCERIIEGQAKKVEGVESCWIDFKTKEGEIVFDSSKIDMDEILDSIEEKGYECFILKDNESGADVASASGDSSGEDAASDESKETETGKEKIVQMRFKVTDMECEKCEGVVEEQALTVDGVENCKADNASRTVEVSFDPSKTNIEEIMQKVEEKGYQCEGLGDDAEEEANASESEDEPTSESGNNNKSTTDDTDIKFNLKGMHCKSCENIIEKQVLSIDGVKSAAADYGRNALYVSFDSSKTRPKEIIRRVREKGYGCETSSVVSNAHVGAPKAKSGGARGKMSYIKPAILTLALVAIIFGGYQMVQGFATFDLPAVGGPASLILLFGIGLLTGFHCVGMCGGFVMSYTTKNAVEGRKSLHLSSHAKYGTGKLISYTAVGALFGLIGTIFVFTPLLRGAASIVAGIFLLIFGLNTLNFIPGLRRLSIPMPKALGRFVFAKSDRQNRPLVTGLLNGLMIACGPLQALYIYAAGTGSVAQGALALFAFGLGTLPVMFGFGMFASYVSKSMTHNILKVSGIIVIILGVIMLNRGLALMGTGYDFNSIAASFVPSVQATAGPGGGGVATVAASGQYQEIRMNVTARGWEPDRFVLKAGVPVKWIINGKEITSCNKAIQVPSLGLSFNIKPGEQVIEFTPPNQDTTIPWSCWMGMIQGTFVVKTNVDLGNQQQVQSALATAAASAPAKASGGCGCGGGGAAGSCH